MALETLDEYRMRKLREAMHRDAPRMRREFWAGKAEGYVPEERRAGPLRFTLG